MTWTLHEGDCLEGMATLADRSVDVIISDPPYSQHTHTKQRSGAGLPDTSGRRRRKGDRVGRACFSRTRELGFDFISPADMGLAAVHFARLARRWVVIFCDEFQAPVWRSKLGKVGLDVVRVGVWLKPGSTPQFTGDRPGQGHESIVIAHRRGKKRWNGGGKHAVWTYPIVLDRDGRTPRLHTTQKPLALMEALVRDFTEPGELVLDPFAGSGTTGVAAIRNGRRFIGWELSAEYADVASRRLAGTREQLGLFKEAIG